MHDNGAGTGITHHIKPLDARTMQAITAAVAMHLPKSAESQQQTHNSGGLADEEAGLADLPEPNGSPRYSPNASNALDQAGAAS